VGRAQSIQESRWVGRVLRDKWRIDRRIARGGMGTVFAATHKNNGSTAAIKILHPEFSRDSDTRSRFLQEGYAANQVNHPGVVRIIDDDVSEEGLAFLVMELLEGELLEQRRIRKGGKLPLVEVYELADQLLDVLAVAHAKGIVHRDIKPDNIFLTRQGRLKVLDFGFAQMKTGFRTEQTATGFLLGTPGFMAPEQAIGNRPLIDAQTDIWAVGATLFILLTGEPVHDGESAAEMLVAAANFPARSIALLEPALPTKLKAIVDRALAFQKLERWPDARSMQAALRAVPGRQPVAEPTPERSRWGRSIPDDERVPPRHSAMEDPTVMEQVVELADDELIEAAEVTAYVPNVEASPETDTTVIMESRPRPDAGFAPPRPSHPDMFPPARMPMPSYPRGAIPGTIPNSERSRQMPTVGDGIRVMPHLARPAEEPRGPKVLVLVLVAAITMVIVILTGLLVILGSD
jgi:eukaryotic-like serine/threonine-protein kinase